MIYAAYQQFKRPLAPTPADIEGPFYKADAPELPSGVLGLPERFGDPVLVLSGKVIDTDGRQIDGAVLDVWQADKHGVYDNEGYKLRGKIKLDYNGKDGYRLETVMPGDYQIADDPPEFRCAHVHFKVTAPGHKPLTTQLYFPDDQYNGTDHWFDSRRVVQHPVGEFDFVLEKMA